MNILFLGDMRGGGTKTFTAHLVKSMRMIGIEPAIYRVGNNTFRPMRDFGYNEGYRLISIEDAIALCESEVCLITSVVRKNNGLSAKLLNAGARTIIHDPLEIDKGHYDVSDIHNPIVIRRSNLHLVPGAVFIPHPFVRIPVNAKRSKLAVSLTRIARIKHTDWLLYANEQLPKRKQITICGAEDRMYSFYTLEKKFKAWTCGGHEYDQEWGTAQRLYAQHDLAIDLTEIPNDGGGSQYAFLEAIDAGSVCVLNSAWTNVKGEMIAGKNCLAVSSREELVELLRKPPSLTSLRSEADKLLKRHDPKKVAKMYKKELEL